jgi:hypothetical protein
MKNLSFIAAFVLCLAGCLSTTPRQELADNDRSVDQVLEASDLTQAQIYSAAVLWVTETYKSIKFDYENQHEGSFIMKAVRTNVCHTYARNSTRCSLAGRMDVAFTMRFEAKDGRYKITYTNINLHHINAYGESSPARPLLYQEEMDVVKPALFQLNTEIQASINRGSNKW